MIHLPGPQLRDFFHGFDLSRHTEIGQALRLDGRTDFVELQTWFVGDHGCVGGGDPKKVELSNITLLWMLTHVKELGLGLELDFSAQPETNKINLLKDFEPDIGGVFRLTGFIDREIAQSDSIHDSALHRFVERSQYEPDTLVNGLTDQVRFRKLERLGLGQSRSFLVDAAKLWNPSGILLEARNSYCIAVEGDQMWKDWLIPADADGYRRDALRLWEPLRRVPDQNWFKLVGTIGRDQTTPIIIGKTLSEFSPGSPGELLCFANDIPWMYWNNCGSIEVTITRVS